MAMERTVVHQTLLRPRRQPWAACGAHRTQPSKRRPALLLGTYLAPLPPQPAAQGQGVQRAASPSSASSAGPQPQRK